MNMIRSIAVVTLLGGLYSTPAVYAQTAEANLSMTRKQGETYEQLLDRANQVAANGLNQRFNQDKSLKWLKLSVFAENEGTMAPLMTVQVSRQDWQAEPKVQRWASVFPYSRTLLGFDTPTAPRPKPPAAPSTTASPAPATASQPTQPPANSNNKPSNTTDNKTPAKTPAPLFDPYPPEQLNPTPLSPEKLIRNRGDVRDAVTGN